VCRRFRRLAEQHKPAPKIAVAIARELAGFLWAALQPAPARTNEGTQGDDGEPVNERDDAGQ
jgi:hypothetical protein